MAVVMLVAVLMLAYGGYFSLRQTLPAITGNWYSVDAGVGFLGGILGAMAGLSGALPSMWIALRPWPVGSACLASRGGAPNPSMAMSYLSLGSIREGDLRLDRVRP